MHTTFRDSTLSRLNLGREDDSPHEAVVDQNIRGQIGMLPLFGFRQQYLIDLIANLII